ncbi:MAG: prolyl oligopeptidase family serine peptidase [Erysipelotrichaceae bacterium]
MITIKHKIIENIPVLELCLNKLINKKLPTVVCYHGWTNYKESALVNGYEIAKKGYRVILPDANLHGERQTQELDEFNYENIWNIVYSSVSELKILKNHYVEKQLSDEFKFSVAGQSMGGITAIACFTKYDWVYAAACLMGTPEPIKLSEMLLTLPWVEQCNKSLFELENDIKSWQDFDLSLQPEKIAGRPLMFWHGTKDKLVPFESSFEFYNKIKDKDFAKNVSFIKSTDIAHTVPYPISSKLGEFFSKI